MKYAVLTALAILTFSHTVEAHAQLEPLPQAISPFVQDVLDRTDDIYRQFVPDLSAADPCENYLPGALQSARSALRTVYANEESARLERESLDNMTVCHRYDLDLLAARMEQISLQMQTAANTCEANTLQVLSHLHNYTWSAYQSVLNGGINPEAADFRARKSFLDYDNTDGDPEATACPFHSDYLAPSVAKSDEDIFSYGCDATVLDHLANLPEEDIIPARKKEAEAMRDYYDSMEGISSTVGKQIVEFRAAYDRILSLIRRNDPPPQVVSTDPPDHETIAGCKEEVVTKEVVDPDTGNVTEEQDPLRVRTYESDDLPEGLSLRSSFSPFSIYRDALGLMRTFMARAFSRGENRPLPYDPTEQMDIFDALFRQGYEPHIRQFSANLEKERAVLISGSDALQRAIEAASPLRDSVRSFGEVTSFPQEGEELPALPMYVRDVAMFLRRSCVHGYCGCKLNAVLARAIEPYCFPYGSDKYLDPDAIKKCLDTEKLIELDKELGMQCDRVPYGQGEED